MQINLIDNSLKGEIHMAKVEYAPQGVCARLMKFEVEDGKLHNLRVLGGCNGNLQGIGKLTEGMELQEIVSRLEGDRKSVV